MMKTIHGYELNGALTSQNAGFCQWGFCKKNGHEFFIKEFLDPKYPVDRELFTPEAFDRKTKICEDFFAEKSRFYKTLEKCRTGNNVVIHDFFREGTKYYIITDRIDTANIGLKDVAALSTAKKETLIRSILYSIAALHNAGIVHSDIKADNVLLKETPDGFITAKIIDFDAGFLLSEPQTSVKGDFVYLSPEAYLKMKGQAITLTEKIDIFALGILFHQYYTGELPKIPDDERCVCTAILNGHKVQLSNTLPQFLKETIERMLAINPVDRPDANAILNLFTKDGDSDTTVKVNNTSGMETHSEVGQARLKKSGFYVPSDLD